MILLTGFTGKLGTELKKHLEVTKFEGDITKDFLTPFCELLIHSAAYTDVFRAEVDQWNCFKVNVGGTYKLVHAYWDTPFVYISTEYAHNPIGMYAHSKFIGEKIVQNHPHHLIIRTLFKPSPWPFEFAYEDQFTQGDYIDVITPLIVQKIESWDKKTSELCYVGTGRKSMFELAQKTRPTVKPNKIVDKFIPKDYL